MRQLAFALACVVLTAGAATAGGWDDSYPRNCCGMYWYRWMAYSGPGYFDRGRWYRPYRHARFVHHRRYRPMARGTDRDQR